MPNPVLIVHSVLGWLGTALSLVLMAPVAWLTRPSGCCLRHYHRWARIWGRVVAAASRVRIEIEGADQLEAAFRQGPMVIVCNHTSVLDTPILLAGLPGYFSFVAKAEVFAVPLMGAYMEACGFIPLKRGLQHGSRDAMSAAVEALAEGRSVLMFPEGTRTPDGALQPFRKGALVLAARTGVPILPVAISGLHDILPKGAFLGRPGVITLRAGPLFHAPAELADDARESKLAAARLRDRVVALMAAPAVPAAVPQTAA